MVRFTDAAAPRADAFIAAASLAAQYLLAIKKLENWIAGLPSTWSRLPSTGAATCA